MSGTDPCLFCSVAKRQVAVHEVYRDDDVMAFLDIGPIREGHVQIIPLAHFPTFDAMPEALAHRILTLGQRIARTQKIVFNAPRVGFLFTGGDIAHVHAHVVPLMHKHDITSAAYITEKDLTYRPIPHPGDAALAQVAERLVAGLDGNQRE